MASPRDDNRSAFPWVRWLEDVSTGLGCAKRESPTLLASRPAQWNSPQAYAQDLESMASTRRGVAPLRAGVAPLRAASRQPYLADNGACTTAFTPWGDGLSFPPGVPSSGAEGPVAERGSPSADFWRAASDAQQDPMRRERRMVEVQLDAMAARIKVLMDKKDAAGDLNAQRMYLSLSLSLSLARSLSPSPSLSLTYAHRHTHRAAPLPAAPPILLVRSVPLCFCLHPGGNAGANLKSISHRCYLFEVAFVWALTKGTIVLPLG